MNNSRHERAIVVLASYVIGFTTAYIAFGVGQPYAKAPSVSYVNNVAQYEIREAPEASIFIDELGLGVITEDRVRLLSARRDAMAANVISATPQPGVAVALTEAELSRDGKFVYFCEQLTEESDQCDPYVYSLEADVLYPVEVYGERYYPNNATHVSAWSPAGYLTVDDYISATIAEPWKLR